MKYYFNVLRNYATFSGRARRREYWYFALFNFIIYLLLAFIGQLANLPTLIFVYCLAVLVPSVAVAFRRMHDVNKSGWYAFIPIYGFVLACTPGTEGENEYGSDPKKPAFNEFLAEPSSESTNI